MSFGSVTSGGLGSEQQSKATKSTVSSLLDPKPGNSKYDHERQERRGFTLGGTNQEGGTKPAFSFGDSRQTPTLSSGFLAPFGSITSIGLGSEQQSEATKSTVSSLLEPKPGITFGFGASSSEGVSSFGSDGTSQSDSKPVFTLGSQNPSSGGAFSYGSSFH